LGFVAEVSLVFIVVFSIVVLVVVTRIAGKRDAARKLEQARRDAAPPADGDAN